MSDSNTTQQAANAERVREWLFTYLRDRHHVALEKLNLNDDATSIGLDSLQMEQLLGDFEAWLGVTIDIASVVNCKNLGELLAYFESLPTSVATSAAPATLEQAASDGH